MRSWVFVVFAIINIYSNAIGKSITVSYNRIASAFSRVFFEHELSDELQAKIEESFNEKNTNDDERLTFIQVLLNNRKDHKYMTPEINNLFEDVLEKNDKFYDKSIDIIQNRKEVMQNAFDQNLSKDIIDLNKVFRFYGSSNSQDFYVFLYSTNSLGNKAWSVGNYIFLRYSASGTILDMLNVLNQIFYYKYIKFIDSVAFEFFAKNWSLYSLPAYNYFKDVLIYATCKYCENQLKGVCDSFLPKLENDNLQNVCDNIQSYVNGYINNSKTIDVDFLKQYLEVFSLSMPESIKDIRSMLSTISIEVESGIDYIECRAKIEKIFGSKIKDKKSILIPYVFIGNNIGHSSLLDIQDKLNEATDKEYLLITRNKHNKIIIVIKSSNQDKINKAIDILSSLQNFVEDFYQKL